MKKSLVCFLVLLGAIISGLPNAHAAPFTTPVFIDLDGHVNRSMGWTGLGDLDGTAKYSIQVESVSAGSANYIDVYFEKDVFASISNFSFISGPSTWTGTTTGSDSNSFLAELSSTTLLTPGQSIQFSVDYVLNNTNAYYDSSGTGPDFEWSIDGTEPWSQLVTAYNWNSTDGILDQGSTSLVVNPEPGTIALLGVGLAGLATVGVRRRMRKKDV